MARQTTVISAVTRKVDAFLSDESGATAIEYALIASGVAVAIAGAVRALGATVLTDLYDKIANAMS